MTDSSSRPDARQDAHPFAGITREQFLGSPRITSDANGATLKPKALKALGEVEAVPFQVGRGLTAKYSEAGAAVFKGDKVIASYNFGDTLVVARGHRRQGIASELVYQWRMRFPEAKPASHRTKKSQALQEKVWERIEREVEVAHTPATNEAICPDVGLTPCPSRS
jgi:hypothetical protein